MPESHAVIPIAEYRRMQQELRAADALAVNMAEKLGKSDREKAALHRRIEELEAVLRCIDESSPLLENGNTLSQETFEYLKAQEQPQ